MGLGNHIQAFQLLTPIPQTAARKGAKEMACPTCDHTMQMIGEGVNTFWCPRCGTIKFGSTRPAHEAPKLVDHCRQFRKAKHPSFIAEVGLFGDPVIAEEWRRLGIEESLTT